MLVVGMAGLNRIIDPPLHPVALLSLKGLVVKASTASESNGGCFVPYAWVRNQNRGKAVQANYWQTSAKALGNIGVTWRAIALFVLVFFGVIFWCHSETFFGINLYKSSWQRESRLQKEAAEKCITDWLDEQHRGGTGFAYWSNSTSSEPIRLYSVQSWEIVSMESSSYRAEANVLISSSTKLGTPIRKTWRISSEQNFREETFGIYEVKDLSE